MKYRIIIILAICALLGSCQDKHKETRSLDLTGGNGSYETISVDLENRSEAFDISEYYDAYFITLEASEESMIGDIDKVMVTSRYIFVLDAEVAQKLFQFDRKGNFIRCIGEMGKGPGEYREIADFDVLEDIQKVKLYADDDRKIITFSFDGQFEDELRIDKDASRLCCFSDGSFLAIGWHSLYDITFFEKNGKPICHYQDKKYPYITSTGLKQVSKAGDSCYFCLLYCNYIYKAKPDSCNIEIAYYLDFGDNNFPLDEIRSKEDIVNNRGQYGLLGAMTNTSRSLFLDIHHNGISSYFIYLKNANKKVITDRLFFKGAPLYQVVGEHMNDVFFKCEAYELVDFLNSDDSNKQLQRDMRLEYLTQESNPVIAVLTPKY